ncbi:unnamed protein product [Lymnaea stagnalis]|uniref:Uncharacterized protein n=1 Tax=Lymnaea stagnalis TaxID=6523 RepID=A0AAV2ING3_LYMST
MSKPPALTISRCMTTLVYLYMFSHTPDCVYGQSVYLDPTLEGAVSPCSSGLRDGLDFYIFKGIVNATGGKLSNLVDFQISLTSSNNFTYLCTASLVSCSTPNLQPCYCAENNSYIYQIVANRSAIISNSKAPIRIQWASTSGTNVTSNILYVPPIYAPNTARTTLTIESASWDCSNTVTLNYGQTIKFECSDSPSPCEVSIAVNNTELVKLEKIATYTVSKNLTSNTTYIFKFSYSVCGGVITQTTCPAIIAEEVTTTTTTSTSAVTNGTTTLTTGTTVTVPTTNSTTAAHVTVTPPCTLNCKIWAIVLSVIYYLLILVIISTGIAILVLAITAVKKTTGFYVGIGLLVFAEVVDIILIIVFAQADPCTCDPEPGIALPLWQIMLIIFCIFNGLLIIAAVVEIIWTFVCAKSNRQRTGPNREITPPADTSAPNKRTPKDNPVISKQNANTLSNENNGKGKMDESFDLQEKAKMKLPDELKKDEAVNIVTEDSENKKGKKKKSKKKKKVAKEKEKESSLTNRSLPIPLSGN